MSQVGTLSYLLINALHYYVFFLTYSVFFHREGVSRRLEFLSFSLAYLLNSAAFLWINLPLLNLGTTLVPMLLITALYPAAPLYRIFTAAFTVIISVLADSITFHLLHPAVSETRAWVSNLSSTLIQLLAVLALRRLHHPGQRRGQQRRLYWVSVLSIPAVSLIVIVLLFFITSREQEWAIVLVDGLLVLINVLVFFLYDRLERAYQDQLEKRLLEHQNRAYAHEVTLYQSGTRELNTLRHDMRNHLATVRQFYTEARPEEVLSYLDRFAERLDIGEPFASTGNPELDSILNYKLGQAARAGAKVDAQLFLPRGLELDVFDLTVILGNLLDNAIEGMARCEEGQLSLLMRADRGLCRLQIENTFDGVTAPGEEGGFLTRKKGGAHGLGLTSVRQALDRHNGLLALSTRENRFIAEAIWYLPG